MTHYTLMCQDHQKKFFPVVTLQCSRLSINGLVRNVLQGLENRYLSELVFPWRLLNTEICLMCWLSKVILLYVSGETFVKPRVKLTPDGVEN